MSVDRRIASESFARWAALPRKSKEAHSLWRSLAAGIASKRECPERSPRTPTRRVSTISINREFIVRNSLQIQILLALAVLGILFASVLALNGELHRRGLADQQQLALVQAVSAHTEGLARNALSYAEVAPRDFESYGRDLLVYFVSLQADLDELSGAVKALQGGYDSNNAETSQTIQTLAEEHAAFVVGLWEKLGDNLAEPRLEWGAAYLAEQAPLLSATAQAAEQRLADNAARHLAEATTLTRLSWLLGLLGIAAIGTWFWQRVARRIRHAAEGCLQVSEGEFGTRIEDHSHDELGAFSRAFNGLSSRTRVVLGVLDQLPEAASAEQAFATLWNESRAHLGQRWQAMFELNPGERSGQLLMLKHDAGFDFADGEQHFELSGIIDSLALEKAGAAVHMDVRRHTLDNRQGRLLRALSRNDLRTLALVLLRDGDGTPRRILAFAWSDANAQNAGVARFLHGLGRFLNRLLVSPASAAPRTPALDAG